MYITYDIPRSTGCSVGVKTVTTPSVPFCSFSSPFFLQRNHIHLTTRTFGTFMNIVYEQSLCEKTILHYLRSLRLNYNVSQSRNSKYRILLFDVWSTVGASEYKVAFYFKVSFFKCYVKRGGYLWGSIRRKPAQLGPPV